MTAAGGQTYRVLRECLVAVPPGMTLRLAGITNTPSGNTTFSFVDVDSDSELLVDASRGAEISRSVRGTAAAQVLTQSRFDAVVASLRFSPEPPPPLGFDSSGNPRVLPKMTMGGGKTYRMGHGEWLLTVPPGMTLRFESVARSGVTGFLFVDVDSGSELALNAGGGGELARRLRGPADSQSLTNSRFDAIVASFTLSPEASPVPARSGTGLRAEANGRWASGALALATLALVVTARALGARRTRTRT